MSFRPPRRGRGPQARGDLQVLWEDTQKTFMKGLTVVDGVAYFGIAEFGGRAERDSSEKTAEVATTVTSARGAFCGERRFDERLAQHRPRRMRGALYVPPRGRLARRRSR